MLDLAGSICREDVQLFYQIGLVGRRDLSLSPEPRGGFEMVMLRMLAFRPVAEGEGVTRQDTRPARPTSAAAAGDKRQETAPPMQVDTLPPQSASEWSGIIDALGLKGMLREMALNCALQGIDGDRISLSLDAAHIHLLNKPRQQQLETALSEHFRRAMKVVIASEGQAEVESPALRQSREKDRRQQRACRRSRMMKISRRSRMPSVARCTRNLSGRPIDRPVNCRIRQRVTSDLFHGQNNEAISKIEVTI